MNNTINVTRSSMPPFEEYCEEIKKLWDSHWLTNMGVEHRTLQKELELFLNCPHTVLFANGHLALETVISAMSFPKGAEVITTPFTFASTTNAIVRNGLIPVFCDINPENYTINTESIERCVTDRTAAIVPVHVYGNLCDVERIDEIAKKHELKVIYDAAHAFAVKYKGLSAACFGDAAMFSFHATKVFNTVEGGAVCCREDSLVEKLNAMKNFGQITPEQLLFAGGNAKMSELHAAMGICNLRHLREEIEKRKAVAERYWSHLDGIKGIKLNYPQRDVESNYAYFPVGFDGFGATRDEVLSALAKNGFFARKYFYPLTNSFACYTDLPTAGAEKTPVAEYIANRVLTLPIYADLDLNVVDQICETIIRCERGLK